MSSSASENKELEEQLVEIGNRLVQPPSEAAELLLLLDQVETFLSRVEQSPPKSTHNTLSPLEKALVAEGFLRHTDIDVRVAVAACISEIMRITAPDAPYDDTQLKDIYPLFVSSFENLSDQSSRSYNKRVLVLETLAKVQSCVVMLDLDCPGLIVEMFQHFLKSIRDYHPESVFSFMETIMTLLLEESEDIPHELLNPILAIVKKDNEEVLPIARILGERVLEKNATKLKPYLTQAMRSLGASLDDYSEVVASVCPGTFGTTECNGGNAIGEQLADDSNVSKASSAETLQPDESKLITAPSDEAAQVVKGVTEEVCPEEVDPSAERSKPINSNGIADSATDGTSVDMESLKKPEPGHFAKHSVNDNVASKADNDDSNDGKSAKTDFTPEKTAKRRGSKPKSLINSSVLLDSFHADNGREAEKLSDLKESISKDVREDPFIDADADLENEKETDVQLSLPITSRTEVMNVSSSSPSWNCPDEGRPNKAGWPKKKTLLRKVALSADVVSKKVSEGTSDSEVKPQRRLGKKATAVTYEDNIPTVVETTQNEGGITNNSEAKRLKQSGKKVDASNDIGNESSTKKEDGKKATAVTNEDKIPTAAATTQNEGGVTNNSEARPLKRSGKKVDSLDDIENKSSLKKKEDGKNRGRGKDTSEKGETKSSAKADVKEVVLSLSSTTKSAQHESQFEETPKTNPKRKHTAGKDQASETLEYGENLVGSKVKVWWPKDHTFYEGAVHAFDSAKKKHLVLYDDGEQEILNLKKQRWELVEGDSAADGEQGTEDRSHDTTSEIHKKKKTKTHSEPLAEQEKIAVSPKRGGAAASNKSKGTSAKSGHKSSDDGKIDGKSKDNTSKSSAKSEDDTAAKSKDRSKKSSKSKDDGSTSKTSTKEDTLQTFIKSKIKISESGSKSSANNGLGKVKSSSSKRKETEGVKVKSPYLTTTPESTKEKSQDISRLLESETHSRKAKRVKS